MAERVSVDPVASIEVTLNGEVVAKTTRGFVVHEQGLDDRYYVPAADVRAELSPGVGAGTCPWKGEWKHLDVTVGGQRIANGAWTYFESKPATAATKDFIAFYGTKFQIQTR
ncbi:MAG TPA: DUF427 domain-containing protein [Kofleriaceae bacterium]|jgi:uncharacterized protein (DUF427 family)